MDPMIRVAEFLRDNVGHLARPGNASFNIALQRWFVPVYCRTERGDVVIGDVELDRDGHIIYAPSKEEMLARLSKCASPSPQPEQYRALQEGEHPARVRDPETNATYVLVPDEVYQRVKALFEEEDENQWVRDMYPHVMEVFGREGWDAPEMDIYNDLDPRRQP